MYGKPTEVHMELPLALRSHIYLFRYVLISLLIATDFVYTDQGGFDIDFHKGECIIHQPSNRF